MTVTIVNANCLYHPNFTLKQQLQACRTILYTKTKALWLRNPLCDQYSKLRCDIYYKFINMIHDSLSMHFWNPNFTLKQRLQAGKTILYTKTKALWLRNPLCDQYSKLRCDVYYMFINMIHDSLSMHFWNPNFTLKQRLQAGKTILYTKTKALQLLGAPLSDTTN